MNSSQFQTLNWVSWNKLTNLIPIRRSNFNSTAKTEEKSRFDINRRQAGLPKLAIKRIIGNNSVPRSPRVTRVFKKFTKTFSPVLTRGRTSNLSHKNSQ